MNILIIEDDLEIRLLLQAVLESRGHTVTAAADGESGWESYQQMDFQIVLLDWLLPGIDGLEVCRKIRSIPKGASSLVMMVTSRTQANDLEQLLAAGADDYLTKPIDLDLLNIRLTILEKRYISLSNQAEAEADKLASKSDLEATLGAIPDQVFELGLDGRYFKVHASQNEFLVVPAETFIGKTVSDVMPAKAAEIVLSGLREAFETGSSYGKQVVLDVPSGKSYFKFSIARKSVPAGHEPRFVVLSHDITEQCLIADALRINEERIKIAAYSGKVAIWEVNLETGKLTWDDMCFTLYKMTRENFGGTFEEWAEHLHPDDLDRVVSAFQKSAGGDGDYDIDFRIIWPDGEVRYIQARGQLVKDQAGNPGRMIGTNWDITEQKQNEESLISYSNRLDVATRSVGNGIWEYHLDTGALEWDDRMFEIYGVSRDQFPGAYEAWTNALHPDDKVRAEDELNMAIAGDKDFDTEFKISLPDGGVRYVKATALVERDDAGIPLRMIGSNLDVTEYRLKEKELLAAKEQAEIANKAKSDFLSNMSHELRTPMNAILGFGQLMHMDGEISDANKDNVREILHAGNHLLELINEVLDLAKIDSGKIDMSLEQVEVCPVIDECLSLIAVLAKKYDISISHGGLNGAVIRADRTRFKQALLNLLSNAIKYNRQGGTVQIAVTAEGTDKLRLLVTDTGQGLTPEQIGDLFKPFNRLDAEKSGIEGTGIGLTITRRIVELMGGSVNVKSEVGVGSTFWIELPLESLSDTTIDPQHIFEDTDPDFDNAGTIEHTVIYIEDNPANMRLVARILGNRKQIKLVTAHTPELGIQLALKHKPELILLDINMPDMDGYQVLGTLKAEKELHAVPVVAITANAMPRDIKRGVEAGFTDYLTKPLDVTLFCKMLDELLGDDIQRTK